MGGGFIRFSSQIFDDNGSQLHLIEAGGRLIIGLQSEFGDGTSLEPAHDEIATIRDALWERANCKIADGALRLTPSNRGEPFREGVSFGFGDGGAVFVEEGYDLERLKSFIEQRAPAPTRETDTPTP